MNIKVSNSQISERSIKHKWSPFARSSVLEADGVIPIVGGRDVFVHDIEGREYLDCHAALWLMNVGYGRQEIADAVHRQMSDLAWFSSFEGYTNVPSTELAELLVGMLEPVGLTKIFFTNSGSESVETALKAARMYWKLRGKGSKHKIISRDRAYHGVNYGGMSVTGMFPNRQKFEPLLPGVRHAMAPDCFKCPLLADCQGKKLYCAGDIERIILSEGPDTVAAIIAEPIQGAGGVIIPPEGYLQEVRRICDKHNILLILDEVITGFGRTGEWFGAIAFDVRPDIMTLAKGITSGYLPLGATAFSQDIFEAFRAGEAEHGAFRHGNTYSGHPTACAAALANIAIIEREGLVANAREVGAYLLEALKPLEQNPFVGEVAGMGLIGRIQLVADKETRAPLPASLAAGDWIARRMRDEGVIIRQLPYDALSFSPPLTLQPAHADRIATAFKKVLGDFAEDFNAQTRTL
jgi:adenosylmethionine-8-amino-7-oxononanoate aminotransferase